MMFRTTIHPAGLAGLAALLLAGCGDTPQTTGGSSSGLAPVSLSLSTAPATVALGQSALLSWRADSATACAASGAWTGSRPVTGSESVTPAALGALTYTLNCTGAGPAATSSITVMVTPVPAIADVVLMLDAAPLTLELGSPVRLTWNAANADACTASGAWSGGKAASGTEPVIPVSPGTVTYRLNCSGPGAPDTEQVTVVVTDPHAASLAEFLRLRDLEAKTLDD